MSSRSVPRGSAAARSIRLALRASSIVATSRPSLARWAFRFRGNLAPKSAMIPPLTCSIPPIPPLHPARSSVGSTAASVTQGQTDGWQAAGPSVEGAADGLQQAGVGRGRPPAQLLQLLQPRLQAQVVQAQQLQRRLADEGVGEHAAERQLELALGDLEVEAQQVEVHLRL